LKQDECRFFTDPSAGLIPLGNEAIYLCFYSEDRLFNTGGFQEDGNLLAVKNLDLPPQDVSVRGGQDHDLDPFRQVGHKTVHELYILAIKLNPARFC
jgi:hypothetical protein